MYDALIWLKANNKIYLDITISDKCLLQLPEDGIPCEIMTVIHHEENGNLAIQERATYVPGEVDDHMNVENLQVGTYIKRFSNGVLLTFCNKQIRFMT